MGAERGGTEEMTRVEYDKVRAGATVRTLVELRNQICVVRANTVMRVMQKRNGTLMLEGERCECCGTTPVMGRVEPGDVSIVAWQP